MKAARLHKPGEPMTIDEIDVPRPKGDEVLIRIAGAGVCHSDLHLIRGHMAIPLPLPLTLGHENTGYVEEVGPQAEGFQKGEAVAVFGGWGCGKCDICLGGEEQLCNVMLWGGIGRPGGYAEYLLVPHVRYLIKLNGLDPVTSAPLTDAALTPYRAVKKVTPFLMPGSFAMVIGLGGLGQFGVQFLKTMSATQVIAVDIDDSKLQHARQIGADFTINSKKEDVGAAVKKIAGEGANAVVDFVGIDQTLQSAAASIARKGRIVLVGLAGGSLPYSFMGLPSEVSITTSTWGSYKDLQEVLTLARQGRIHSEVEPVALEAINETFDRLEHGQIKSRAVVAP